MFKSVEELVTNPSDVILSTSELLLKYIENILRQPTDMKYRRIRIGNELVTKHLLSVPGGMECLLEMGFEEDGEYMTLLISTPLTGVRRMKKELNEVRQSLNGSSGKQQKVQPRVDAPRQSVSLPRTSAAQHNPASQQAKARLQSFEASEKNLAMRIRSDFIRVLVYEKRSLQEKARAVIPRSDLQQKAEVRMASAGLERSLLRDLYLIELLAWFKSFFTWTDCLPCSSCHGSTANMGMLDPTPQELQHGASRVENHCCSVCNVTNRFPRYNDPGKLLETRTGRCGEWANCFTLCCRAEGFEARHVVDWTDHVWTEVYSEARQRWVHCDPCENVSDKPLIYEGGWGKKLTYVMAYSCDDIQDVTWRYTLHHAETLQRRNECREEWLVALILRLRAERQKPLAVARKRHLLERNVSELVELLLEPSSSGQNLGGRTTGSLDWRLSRGELGATSSPFTPTVIIPTDEEIQRGVILLRYSCAKDMYVRGEVDDSEISTLNVDVNNSDVDGRILRGWKSLAFEATNVELKIEHDWKKSYIARYEGCVDSERGSIGWKISLEGKGVLVDWIRIRASSECFSSGSVSWRLCGDEECMMLGRSVDKGRITELSGSTIVHLVATLSGGQGSSAWQHAQLFRQSLDDTSEIYPLELVVHTKSV